MYVILCTSSVHHSVYIIMLCTSSFHYCHKFWTWRTYTLISEKKIVRFSGRSAAESDQTCTFPVYHTNRRPIKDTIGVVTNRLVGMGYKALKHCIQLLCVQTQYEKLQTDNCNEQRRRIRKKSLASSRLARLLRFLMRHLR